MLVARVVPDVSGIDKEFDYRVPERLLAKVSLGARVRVDLHGRRVGGWIVALGDSSDTVVEVSKLRDISSVSGAGVEPSVVGLTSWVAEQWRGSRRAVLASASAPSVREQAIGSMRHLAHEPVDHPVAQAAQELLNNGGGCLRVPPLDSALFAVLAASQRGPTVVVCPTLRMAHLAGAWLRRHSRNVAVVPDEWARARAGVDVVVGARSAVFAPCPDLAAIVVIDEHDESLKEERNPTWDALSVAWERARREDAVVLSTSPVPSAQTHQRQGAPGQGIVGAKGWPSVHVVDLANISPAGSLLGSELLEACRAPETTTLCILNTVGVARLVMCRSCRAVQRCHTCRRALVMSETDSLRCEQCNEPAGSICRECGRTSLLMSRLGIAGLAAQIERATGLRPLEVTAETDPRDLRDGSIVGTEAVLNRVSTADIVVFCDIDRDLNAPRLTAPREVLAQLVKAARIVGSRGRIVIQTRDPGHPLLDALTSPDPDAELARWCVSDLALRNSLAMPPFAVCARITTDSQCDDKVLSSVAGAGEPACDISFEGIDSRGRASYVVRSENAERVHAAIERWEKLSQTRLRVHWQPVRY